MAEQSPRALCCLKLIPLAVISCCLASTGHAADVYKVVDEDGRVTYTDQPPKDKKAEKVDLPQVNSLPRARVTKRLSPEEPESNTSGEYQLQISYPPDEFHVNPGMRDLSVQVAVDPPLHPDHELQITDNGAVVDGTTLENIVVRGPHIIQARVVNSRGRTISQSEPTTIYVHRPAVKN